MASRIATYCADYIGKHGPTSVDELHDAARAAQVTAARTPNGVIQAIRYRDEFHRLPDGRYTTTSRLLTGSVLTHRIRTDTRDAGDQLWFGRELSPLRSLFGRTTTTMPLAGGGELTSSRYHRNVWTGPSGWLPPLERDDLIGLRWDGSAIEVSEVILNDMGDEYEEHVSTVLRRHQKDIGGPDSSSYSRPDDDDLAQTVLSALLEVPDLLRYPVRPLDEFVGASPGDCVRELCRSLSGVYAPEHEAPVTLSIPEPLLVDFNQRAELSGIDPHELMIAVLARAAYSSSPRDLLSSARRFPERSADPWDEPELLDDGSNRHLRML